MFSGVMPPLTTPFSQSGEVLHGALEANLERYLQTELSGFLVLGSNGEAVHLSSDEQLEIVRRVRSCTPADRTLIVGISQPTLEGAKRFIDRLGDMELNAFLVSVPGYYRNRMNRKALQAFFEGVAEHASAPLLLYNVPQYSGIEIEPELVAQLAGHEKIIGMKESSGNLNYLQRLLAHLTGVDFQVILGSAQVLGPATLLGIRAAILAVACALPTLPIRVLEAAGSEEEKRLLMARLFTVAQLVTVRFGVPGLKCAMDLSGFHGGACRLPLLPLEREEKREIEATLRPLLEEAAVS